MTKEETINHLKDILAEATETEHAVCYVTNEDAEALEMAIEELKQPERKTGKWIGNEYGECSACGHTGCASDIWDRCAHTYCPNCGSKLEV